MKQYVLLSLLSLMLAGNILGQSDDEKTSLLVESNSRINLLPLSFGYEKKIANKSTVYGRVGVGLGLYQDLNSNEDFNFVFLFRPTLAGEYRYFYNMERRQEKGKNTFMNSGNYVGGALSFNFPPLNVNDGRDIDADFGFAIGPVWGAQRNSKNSRFSFVFSIGPAVYYSASTGLSPTLIGELSLGFLINKID